MEHACRYDAAAGLGPRRVRSMPRRRGCISLRADFGPDLSKLSASARGKDRHGLQPRPGAARAAKAISIASADNWRRCSASRARASIAAPAASATFPPSTHRACAGRRIGRRRAWRVWIDIRVSVQTAFGALAGDCSSPARCVVLRRAAPRRARHVCRVCGVDVPAPADMCRGMPARTRQKLSGRRPAERAEQRRADEAEEPAAAGRGGRTTPGGSAAGGTAAASPARRSAPGGRRETRATRRSWRGATPRSGAAPRQPRRSTPTNQCSTPTRRSACRPAQAKTTCAPRTKKRRSKYDPDLVADLGYDAKEHFEKKFRAVERAYRMLAEASL